MCIRDSRYPFQLVDKVIEIGANYIVGIKNITANEPFFQGHFPQDVYKRQANVGAVQETSAISWVQIVLLVYLAGILFLACRNIYSLICLFRLIHSGKHEKLEKGVTLVVHNQEIAPFSWMNYIVISRKDLEENGREILIHEI